MIVVYTDGACQKTRGGWAFVTMIDGVIKQKSGSVPDSTNNQMEMRAAIEAMRAFPAMPIMIVTDSKYLMEGFRDYMPRWKKNGWRTSTGDAVKNKALWMEMDELAMGRKVEWQWVKGHNHDPLNEKADKLAQAAAAGDFESNGFKATHRHIKTGGLYRLVRDKMVKWEPDWQDVAVYENAEGLWIVRYKSEFEETERFEKLKRQVAGEAM